MNHRTRLRVLASVVLFSLVLGGGVGSTRAQEATPAAGGAFQMLGLATGVLLPSPADLVLARVGFNPGESFSFDASDPNGVLVLLESGELTIRVDEQGWTISRGAALQQAMTTAAETGPDLSGVMEEVARGEAGTLQAGDVAYIPGNLTGEVRNDGQEPASALLVEIGPTGAMLGGAPEATPTS